MSERKNDLSHQVRRQLIKHRPAYVESIGRIDMSTLHDVAEASDGKGTILRLIMGATVRMPLRALSYVDSALQIGKILPFEQLQVVHVNDLGNRINGVPLDKSRQQAGLLAEAVKNHVKRVAPELSGRILHGEDLPIELEPHIELARSALAMNPQVASKLGRKGAKHGGDEVAYAAAHFINQDIDALELRPLVDGLAAEQVEAGRIVSIGCSQERAFYLARMGMRAMAEEVDLVPSAQIFTRHLTPPYFPARGGEPLLQDQCIEDVDLRLCGDESSRRDLEHLIGNLMEGANNG